MEERTAGSAIEPLGRVLKARSLAVVGASNDPAKFGGMTMRSLIEGGYSGRLYPVNPKAGEVGGRPAFRSVSEIPGSIDAAVVVVPARFVAGVLEEAAAKGAAGAIVQSAGFREAGREDLEAEILAAARRSGLRLLGPNIQGVAYLPNDMQAVFFPVIRVKGPLAVVSQSGSVTAALSEWAERDGLGLCVAVNLGNQTDLTAADYLDYLAGDDQVGVIALYVEGLSEGRRFLGSLGRAAAGKPVVILKGGRTEAGARSAASHTGSLAGSHQVFRAACRQYGAVVVNDLAELYDAAKGLAGLKSPAGRRVLTISTSGGAGTLASDEAESLGLAVEPLPPRMIEELKPQLPPLAHLANPLDMANIRPEDFVAAAEAAERHAAADVILVSFADPVAGGAEAVGELARRLRTPLAVSYMGGGSEELSGSPAIQRLGVPVFPSPERAVRGIAAAVARTAFLRRRTEGGRG